MAIPMQLPAQFLLAVVQGLAQRNGSVLQDIASGQVLGHLKEVGTWARLASSIPVDNPAHGVVELAEWADTHHQLSGIAKTLGHLQLLGSVGAVASVAGLGTSVLGFHLVLRRLDRLEQNVLASLGGIRAEVERLHLKTDLLQLAELHAASEQLDGARQHLGEARSRELLETAEQTFQKYRNYYYLLLREMQPQEKAKVPLASARRLIGRLQSSAQAELECHLLLGDFHHWRFRHERILAQLTEVCHFDPKAAVRVRADGLLTTAEMKGLGDEAVMTRDFCVESTARTRTAASEVDWLERDGIGLKEYLYGIAQAPDEGVVLVPHR